MTKSSRWILAASFAITATGFLLPFWPLSVVGILIAALSGRFALALVMGVLVDLGWGIPVGPLHYIFFPFTILALVGILARIFAGRYFLDRSPSDTI